MMLTTTTVFLLMALIPAICLADTGKPLVPAIDGEWRQIAGVPHVGKYSDPGQEPVDFAIWQAKDGSWQLWSCIRKTKCGGRSRLFHRWEAKNITDADWEPKGIAMEADPSLGETAGGLQAPHVVRWKNKYVMTYGCWTHICFATSSDGKTFKRVIQPDGKTPAFGEGLDDNARDAMLLFTKGQWRCYYTAYPKRQGYDFCRTSPDLKKWSDSFIVAYGGQSGNDRGSAECPFVVEPRPGYYVLFRTQTYRGEPKTSVYGSANPHNFGIDDDRYLLCTLPVAAPEIILHEGQYYIAALNPDLKGIRIARLKWTEAPVGDVK